MFLTTSTASAATSGRGSTTTKLRRYKPSRAGKKRAKKDEAHVSRPMNAFMVWQKEQRPIVQQRCPHLQNHMVSIELGRLWKTRVSSDQKAAYARKASRYAEIHKQQHPDYKYRPKTKGKGDVQNTPDFSPSANSTRSRNEETPRRATGIGANGSVLAVDPLVELRSLLGDRRALECNDFPSKLPLSPEEDPLLIDLDVSELFGPICDVPSANVHKAQSRARQAGLRLAPPAPPSRSGEGSTLDVENLRRYIGAPHGGIDLTWPLAPQIEASQLWPSICEIGCA